MKENDYAAALDAIHAWNEGPYTASDVFMECHLETIIHALRFAEKMMQEPSEDITSCLDNYCHRLGHEMMAKKFKAMRDQALKELGE